jgi:hypothetical protein
MSWILDLDRSYSQRPRCPSGEWDGVFYQDGLVYRVVLRLTFSHTCVDGCGYDEFGEFEVLGRYVPWTGECIFSKRYVDGDCVFYLGTFDGEIIEGEWYHPELEIGEFRFWPFESSSRLDAPASALMQPSPLRTQRTDRGSTAETDLELYSRRSRRARLLKMTLGNEAVAERLIEFERRCAPSATEADCIDSAIDHLRRDNKYA